MSRNRYVLPIALAVLALTGCASPGTDTPPFQPPNTDTEGPVYEGDCIVDDLFPLADSLPAGYAPMATPDCIYEASDGYYGVYLDGDATFAASEAALGGAGWIEVDTHAWDNQDVGTVSFSTSEPDDFTAGFPSGWTDTVGVAAIVVY